MSVVEPIARALAYRWGKFQEQPPDCIDELMTELTASLQEAEEHGDEARAESLDAAIDILAQGVAEHKRQESQGFHTATLERAMAEIRMEHRRGEGAAHERGAPECMMEPRGQRAGGGRRLSVSPCQRPT